MRLAFWIEWESVTNCVNMTSFFSGIPRLLLAAGLRLFDRSPFGFLHTQIQVGWTAPDTKVGNIPSLEVASGYQKQSQAIGFPTD
jgi:hypothetical protein